MSEAEMPRIPFAAEASRALEGMAAAAPAIAAIDGATLLGERAALEGLRIGGRIAPGGGCRLIEARGGAVALN
ncbi:MAG: hypothetical protein ABW173_09045, partial [Sphingomonas sp.]